MTKEELPLLSAGTDVDRYRIEALLGIGGMAAVYRVRHRQLGTLHALKLLTLDHPSVRRRVLLEGRVQATIRHPNLVAVTDVVEHQGRPALVLEYVHGPSLDRLLESRRLALAQVDLLARGILRGVAHAHSCGVIHRDLKPANVLLAVRDRDLVPKIADFGIVKVVDEAVGGVRTRVGVMMGTPAYMAPEQMDDASAVDPRADVFSLGAMLYELCTGQRAFDGQGAAQVCSRVAQGQYRPTREVVPTLPERMEIAIRGALQVDRAERIPTVEALLATWCGSVPDEQVALVFNGPPPVWNTETMELVLTLCGGELPRESLSPDGASARRPGTFAFEESEDPLPAPLPPRTGLRLAVGAGLAAVAALVVVAVGMGLVSAVAAGLWAREAPPVAEARVVRMTHAPLPAPSEHREPAVPEPPQIVPDPAPAAPARKPARAEEPVVAEIPEPAPTEPPTVAPEPTVSPTTGEVLVTGNVSRVYLRSSDGGTFSAGRVAPGTYAVVAWFDDRAATTVRQQVEVTAGDTVVVHCAKSMRMCR